jgi:hypothetical protein
MSQETSIFILYASIIILYIICALLYLRLVKLQKQFFELVRKIALVELTSNANKN